MPISDRCLHVECYSHASRDLPITRSPHPSDSCFLFPPVPRINNARRENGLTPGVGISRWLVVIVW